MDRVTACLPFNPPPGMSTAEIDWYAQRGREAHKAVQYYEEDRLDPSSLSEVVQPYFMGWLKFRGDTDWITRAVEFEVKSEKYNLVGRPDLIGSLDRFPSLLDLKSGIPPKPNTWPLQLAAYEKMILANVAAGKFTEVVYWEKVKRLRRIVVQLPGDGSYKLHSGSKGEGCSCCDFSLVDFSIYLAYLTVYRFEKKEGLKCQR